MKIVILSDYFDNRGGAVGVAKALAFGLKKLGHDVSVITTAQNKTNTSIILPLRGISRWETIMEVNGNEQIPVYYIYSDYNLFWRSYICLYNPQTIKTIEKIFADLKPNIVHAHNVHTHLSYYSLKLAKKSGAKVFLTTHDVQSFHYGKLTEFVNPKNLSCPEKFNYKISAWQQIKKAGKTYNPFRNFIIRRYLKYVDKIFAVSEALKQALEDNGISNITVVYNGIDADSWQVDDAKIEEFKKKYKLEDRKIILFGGRISKANGMTMMVAMRKIAETVPQAVLLVAAKIDKAAENMIKTARDWRIADKIIVSGWLAGDELRAAYWSSNVIVVPSVYMDSCPLINMEAMACGKPVVATCFGGGREIVLDGETGYIVNPFDIDAMADKIIDLLQNPEKAIAFGEAGYERIKTKFNLDKMVNDYLCWYNK